MKVTHLYHSGVFIEFHHIQIFIDVITNVDHLVDEKKEIYFLSTHSHSDHFQDLIFNYKHLNVRYILSDDIKVKEEAVFVKAYGSYDIGNLKLKTYGTTDRGVSFLIFVDDKTIFHTGDLNWWHWNKDSVEDQNKEAEDFKREVGLIAEKKIHLLFAPVDPRLENMYYLAGKHFLEEFEVAHFVPIHFRDDFDVTKRFANQYEKPNSVIHVIEKRNHALMIPNMEHK